MKPASIQEKMQYICSNLPHISNSSLFLILVPRFLLTSPPEKGIEQMLFFTKGSPTIWKHIHIITEHKWKTTQCNYSNIQTIKVATPKLTQEMKRYMVLIATNLGDFLEWFQKYASNFYLGLLHLFSQELLLMAARWC